MSQEQKRQDVSFLYHINRYFQHTDTNIKKKWHVCAESIIIIIKTVIIMGNYKSRSENIENFLADIFKY